MDASQIITPEPDTVSSANEPAHPSWLAVFSLSLGAAIIVTTEFIPVGFLTYVAADLDVSLGTAGLMILVPGLSAAVAAPMVIVGAGRIDRRRLILVLGVLVALSNAIASIAPNMTVLLLARIFLGVAIGGFWGVVPALGFRLAGQQSGTRATAIILAGLSAGTVIGLPAGRYFGDLIGWRPTFAVAAGLALAIVAIQTAVLPRIPAIGRMSLKHLSNVFRAPIGRAVLITAGVVTVGQFAASTFVTPFLLHDVRMAVGPAILVFLGYGVAGIVGTLVGPALVERNRMLTFAGSAVLFGAVLTLLPALAGSSVVVSVGVVMWGAIWGLVPLALQTHMLTATPEAPEAASAVLITVMQFSIAIGAGLGGILVDSAGLTAVFVVSGLIAIGAGLLGLLARNGA